jgi:fructuronate reductase/mannitol 2-dehydrogenase
MLELDRSWSPAEPWSEDVGVRSAAVLCDETLDRHAERVRVPEYPRAELAPGVVHLGVGSFHRSHQAVYFDDLATLGERAWGVVGVGFRRARMLRALTPQNALYTLVTRGTEGDEARVIGAMTRYLHAPRQPDAVLAALSDERVALVTLTITADGYRAHDGLVRVEPPELSTALDHLVEGLDRRRRSGLAPFTVLSCDNLPDNGAAAREAVLAIAHARDPRLARWIAERGAFPNSMVDRITPSTTASDVEYVAEAFGVRDRWPVITEPFSQWVVEDDFCNARPPLDLVGVSLVSDVAPYALMKTRLLNATHCAIGFLGSLAGMTSADQVMRDPIFNAYVTGLMDREITPLLPEVPGVDLSAYKETLHRRLGNAKLADDLSRLCRAGSAKVPAHLLSSIAEARERGTEFRLLTLAVAGWMRFLRGTDRNGRALALDDPLGEHLRTLALAGGSDPRPLLAERSIFGDLADDERFVTSLSEALSGLETRDPRALIAGYLLEGHEMLAV